MCGSLIDVYLTNFLSRAACQYACILTCMHAACRRCREAPLGCSDEHRGVVHLWQQQRGEVPRLVVDTWGPFLIRFRIKASWHAACRASAGRAPSRAHPRARVSHQACAIQLFMCNTSCPTQGQKLASHLGTLSSCPALPWQPHAPRRSNTHRLAARLAACLYRQQHMPAYRVKRAACMHAQSCCCRRQRRWWRAALRWPAAQSSPCGLLRRGAC